MRRSVCVFPEPGSPVMPILTGAARRRGTIAKLQRESRNRPEREKGSVPVGPGVLRPHNRPREGVLPAVYPVREDTVLLLPFAAEPGAGRLLEVGCGNGELSLAAARAGWSVVATDRNPHALARLVERARAGGERVAPVRTDLAAGLRTFDRILANPPYLPTSPGERDPDRWTNLALDGGPDGLDVARRIVAGLRDHLAPGGRAFLLLSSLSPAPARDAMFAPWLLDGGDVTLVASRELAGERLSVWRLTRSAPRAGGSPRRTARRRSSPPLHRSGSNPAPGRGRSSARGGASGRRRSHRGS